eukprot:6428346-Prymnesium_polylepis.1
MDFGVTSSWSGIQNLQADDFVKVGDSCFVPDEDAESGRVFCFYPNRDLRRAASARGLKSSDQRWLLLWMDFLEICMDKKDKGSKVYVLHPRQQPGVLEGKAQRGEIKVAELACATIKMHEYYVEKSFLSAVTEDASTEAASSSALSATSAKLAV